MIDFNRVYELSRWLDDLMKSPPKRFDGIAPKDIPVEGGIYIISDMSSEKEEHVYVGLTGNLNRRVHTDHLQGDDISSPTKTALVYFKRTKDMATAKEYMRQKCVVRFDVVPDHREREMREGFVKAILKPEFSLYKSKEH